MHSGHQVFISYDRDDAALARHIRERLVEAGVRSWMDAFDIPPGANWPEAIDRGLEESDIVIGILTPSALASRNVRNEWDWAIENHKQLVLVRTAPCVLPHRYVSINLIDAPSGDLDATVEQIVRATGIVEGARPVSAMPRTRYARSGEVSIAYQIVGRGPVDIVMVPGFISHVEHYWQDARAARFLDRIASFSRLILFDKRGTGLSDRVAIAPNPEARMDDIRAVMDAAEAGSAILLGMSEGGCMACLFAATHPDRTRGLIVYGAYATDVWKPDYTWAPPIDVRRRQIEEQARTIHQDWGTLEAAAAFLHALAPSAQTDTRLQQWVAALHRDGASPGAAIALLRMNLDLDIRPVVPAIRAPALVIHRTGDRMCSIEGGRYIAGKIPGARLVELPGDDHLPWIGDMDGIIDAIAAFSGAGMRPAASAAETELVLATFLTVMLPSAPDADPAVREAVTAAQRLIEEARGRRLDTRECFLTATFDGPVQAIRCAVAVATSLEARGVSPRVGLHTGQTLPGTSDCLAAGIASEAARTAAPGEVLVTQTVKDLVADSGIAFVNRGRHVFTGLPEAWSVHAVNRSAAQAWEIAPAGQIDATRPFQEVSSPSRRRAN
jgi:pimeloyl-ACP methyl ester carboxylesterase